MLQFRFEHITISKKNPSIFGLIVKGTLLSRFSYFEVRYMPVLSYECSRGQPKSVPANFVKFFFSNFGKNVSPKMCIKLCLFSENSESFPFRKNGGKNLSEIFRKV